MLGAAAAALVAAAALLWGPYTTGLDPEAHAYAATVWVIAIWVAVHAGIGGVMLLYCLARSLTANLTPVYDVDVANVSLYWHFVGVQALLTVATIAFFPLAV